MKRQLVICIACMALAARCTNAPAALLSVDFNDRTAGAGGGPSPTQGPFAGWKMSGTTAASSALETQAVGPFNVSLQAFDDHQDENSTTTGIQDTTGQIDDRLRT